MTHWLGECHFGLYRTSRFKSPGEFLNPVCPETGHFPSHRRRTLTLLKSFRVQEGLNELLLH